MGGQFLQRCELYEFLIKLRSFMYKSFPFIIWLGILCCDSAYLWCLRDVSLLEPCWMHVSAKHHL